MNKKNIWRLSKYLKEPIISYILDKKVEGNAEAISVIRTWKNQGYKIRIEKFNNQTKRFEFIKWIN